MQLQQAIQVLRVLNSLQTTGIHSRMAILILAVYEKEGLKQVDYAEALNWTIQIVNRHAINMERAGMVELVKVDSDPRGKARAIILTTPTRDKLKRLFEEIGA